MVKWYPGHISAEHCYFSPARQLVGACSPLHSHPGWGSGRSLCCRKASTLCSWGNMEHGSIGGSLGQWENRVCYSPFWWLHVSTSPMSVAPQMPGGGLEVWSARRGEAWPMLPHAKPPSSSCGSALIGGAGAWSCWKWGWGAYCHRAARPSSSWWLWGCCIV